MRYLLFLLTALMCTTLFADESGVFEKRRSLTISPIYQNWNVELDNRSVSLSETSNLVSFYVPVNERVNFTISGMQAYVSNDGVITTNTAAIDNFFGINDVQLAGNIYVPNIRAVFGLKANLPTGKRDFVAGDYLTLTDLSNPAFRFRVPSFGQGLNLSPSVIIAQPAGESVVLGFGLSYTYRGAFSPFDDQEDVDLNPGDEFLATAGFDYRINQVAKFATDVTFGLYSKDSFSQDGGGSEDVFQAGNRLRVNSAYKHYFGYNILQIKGIFRTEAKNELLTIPNPSDTETIPGSVHLIASFAQRISQLLTLGYSVDSRFYQDNGTTFSGGPMFGFALSPQLSFSKDMSMPILLRFRTASYNNDVSMTGFEAGLGINFRF
ncbi:MAG: hypothetical protein ACRBF0_02520 [Calditrichia bacterium]